LFEVRVASIAEHPMHSVVQGRSTSLDRTAEVIELAPLQSRHKAVTRELGRRRSAIEKAAAIRAPSNTRTHLAHQS
jgi:hypothetical protein